MLSDAKLRIVTFRYGAIGDSLMAFPILRAIRAKYPNSHITFIGHAAIVQLAQESGLAEEAHDPTSFPWGELYDDEGIRSPAWRNLLQQTDLAISLLRNGADPLKPNLLVAGAREAIVAHEYQHPVPQKHVVEYLAHSIGLEDIRADAIPPIALRNKTLYPYNPPIAIHPGCSDPARRWSAASFAAIINALLRQNQPVLLLAGPLDDEQLRKVQRHIKEKLSPGLLTILRNAPLVEVAQQIQHCKCYLGNDSGITHLAALLGVPTVVLMHRAYIVHMHPLGPAVELIPIERSEQVPVERVFKSVQRYV